MIGKILDYTTHFPIQPLTGFRIVPVGKFRSVDSIDVGKEQNPSSSAISSIVESWSSITENGRRMLL